MKDVNRIIDSMLSSGSEANIDSLARMIKNGEAGITPGQVRGLADKLSPMLDDKQKKLLRRLMAKL